MPKINYKEKALVTVLCTNCKNKFQITTNTFRKMKNINRIDWICKKCRKEIIGEKISKTKKETWASKTPEEREEHRKNTSLGMQKMSEDMKKTRSNKLSIATANHLKNLSSEDKNKRNEKRSISCKNTWINKPEKEKLERNKKIGDSWNRDDREERLNILHSSNKVWRDNLDNEGKKEFSEKVSKGKKESWKNLPEEKKKKELEKLDYERNKYWKNITLLQKWERSVKLSNSWEKKPEKEKEIHLNRLFDGRDKYHANMTIEERKTLNNLLSELGKEAWKNRSPEVIKEIGEYIRDSLIMYWENLSAIDRKLRGNMIKVGMKNMDKDKKKNRDNKIQEWWDNLTPEQYDEWDSKRSIGLSSYYNNLGNNPPNKNESDFINDLNKYNINYKYQWVNRFIHKNFKKIFSCNIVTNTEYVSKRHWWDFIIYTKQGNILVDVDGSKHDPEKIKYYVNDWKGRRFKQIDMIKFYDAQRIYKTDNMDAYVIEAYDDIINNDTKVLELNTNKYISYKEFINMIQLMNYSDKELREIL